MKATLRASPVFYLTITREELQTLVRCSECHYDFVCKSSALYGGFLFGWINLASFDESVPDIQVSCNFRELDICSKILECAPAGVNHGVVFKLKWNIKACVQAYRNHLEDLSFEVL